MHKNNNVIVNFYEKRDGSKAYISLRDLTDPYNEPSGFTKKVRGIEKAWNFITQIFNDERLKDDLTFSDIRKLLDEKFNLDVHTYCARD